MDLEICKKCRYYYRNLLLVEDVCAYYYVHSLGESKRMVKCKDISQDEWGYYPTEKCCSKFAPKPIEKWGHYIPSLTIALGDDKMRNDHFKTVLRSKDEKECEILSTVDINCTDYETFKKVVEAVMPILEKEDIKKCN